MAMPREFLSYQKSRSTLWELERLVALRSQFLEGFIDVSGIGAAILKKIEILRSNHVVFTKGDCLLDIERLGEIRMKIREGTMTLQDGVDENHHVLESHLQGGGVVDEIMKVKLGALIRLCDEESEADRVYNLERLAELARKISDSRIRSAIADKIKILTQSMFSTPCPSVRAETTSSDDSDSVVIMSPDDNGSTSSMEDDRENVLKDQVEDLQHDLRRARSDIAALGNEIDVRDVQIGRLTARVASFAPYTTDLPEDDKIKQAVSPEVKSLVAENTRLTEELANAHKTLGQINSSLRTQRTPYQPPPPPAPPLSKSDFNIEVPLGAEGMVWPGHFPARPAEKQHMSNVRRNFVRPPNRGVPTRVVNRRSEPPSFPPQFPPKPTGNYPTSNNWPNFDIPTHSAWPVPNAPNHQPWDEHSTCETWEE